MISASLWVDGRESYGVFSHMQSYDYRLEGRSEKGGAIGLDAAEITMKCGLVDLDGGDEYTPVKIIESDLISFYDGKLVARAVNETIRAAVWAGSQA